MPIFNRIFVILILCFLTISTTPAEDIKHKDFTIVYDSPELKYYARIIKEQLIIGMTQLEIISGLTFKRKILINLYKNADALLDQKKIMTAEDILFRLDTETSITMIITPPNEYFSSLPFPIMLQKKLFYVLFRQNHLPENVWFEEAFFEIILNETNCLGLISMTELPMHIPFKFGKKADLKENDWELAKEIKNTPESITQSIDKIKYAKTMLFFQRNELLNNDIIKTTKICNFFIERLKNNTPWQEKLNIVPNENFISLVTKKRNLYEKIMENFNIPSSNATQNITQEYIFRMILRLLIKKQTDLAYKLFLEIQITPPNNAYFPELGLFFAKKNKTDQNIWLEYFLLNQEVKKPIDFNVPEQVSILLLETLSQEMPDFQVTEKELDFQRTLQFLLYLGRKNLIWSFIEKNNEAQSKIELKNLIWGLGVLLNNKEVIKDYDDNFEFYKTRIWDVTREARK
jgi:hypothetical protein